MNSSVKSKHPSVYRIVSLIVLIIFAILFLFPLYWIITGAFKPTTDIYAADTVWWPTEWVTTNFEKLFSSRTAPLFTIGDIEGPTVPAAIRWLVNSVFMSVMAMLLTCVTASMAGYALAKKRFIGRGAVFTLIVCAMALPKQVILIPLIREISAMGLYNSLWAVILPTVGWPFGVFLMKQFCEGVPGEMLEAARIDGAGEAQTFVQIVMPLIKPGIGALAIFTFINSWNDYFTQLIMLTSSANYTISVGIATLQGESSTDFGILMAGAALAAVPIITVFLIFQKYFTQGITMGAVKG
ncbi:MAG: carbohydrate ABC transporter permease [Clostridiales bacterium]|nr:carbohydrate ABC transporter permease [Clostridiales bacterium]MCD7802704.1 carbohydrate ABC transporter permease [Clostridiales bacterium]